MTDDFILKWDEQNQQLTGEDPDTGDKIPVPIESLSTDDAEIGNSMSFPFELTEKTDQRELDTVYKNDTGNPLYVSIAEDDEDGERTEVRLVRPGEYQYVGNTDAGNGTDVSRSGVTAIIEPGHEYELHGTGFERWSEAIIGGEAGNG